MATAFLDAEDQLPVGENIDTVNVRPGYSMPYLCDTPYCSRLSATKCPDCNLNMCDPCMSNHFHERRANQRISSLFSSPVNLPQLPAGESTACSGFHSDSSNCSSFCNTCSVYLCTTCVEQHITHSVVAIDEAVESSQAQCKRMFANLQKREFDTKLSLDQTNELFYKCNANARAVSLSIIDSFTCFESIINKHKSLLLSQVEEIRANKLSILREHQNMLLYVYEKYKSLKKDVQTAMESGSHEVLLRVINESVKTFKDLPASSYFSDMESAIRISFDKPDKNKFKQLINSFDVHSRDSFFIQDSRAQEPLQSITNNEFWPNITFNENMLMISRNINSNFSDIVSDNTKTVTSQSSTSPERFVNFPVVSRLFPVNTQSHLKLDYRYYTCLGILGRPGHGNGEFCRPWGVCCDQQNNIIVADRSNNRIQVFNENWQFVFTFGKQGKELGQLNRPAGVAADKSCNIIVADKDNHRIQIFNKKGIFMLKFGEMGSATGQFQYPWDVDVNSINQILVSDTRNHRVQLFKSDGTFITKFGCENNSDFWKNIDSPRGVCFISDNSFAITDFNNHRVVIFSHSSKKPLHFGRSWEMSFMGQEGSKRKQFSRPQGIAVNQEGHLIVVDSKNNRIQVFDRDRNLIDLLCKAGSAVGELDRPCGVCVTKDNKIVVVDFGNNRVQLFDL